MNGQIFALSLLNQLGYYSLFFEKNSNHLPEFLGNVSIIYGKCAKNIWEMLQKYMGNVTQLYGKCVKYYMGSVLLGSDTQPFNYLII